MFYGSYPVTGGGGVSSLNGLTGALTLVGAGGITITPNSPIAGDITITGSGGTVTSVALADGSTSPIYSISGSPVTSSGTLSFTLMNQAANQVFAGPATGASTQPNFRSLVIADLSFAGQPNGVATLDPSGKIPASELPSTLLEYQGLWNPSTNTPTLQDSTGTNGFVYQVSVAFAGPIAGLNSPTMVNFQVGNLVIFSSAAGEWQQTSSLTGVTSVNGATGAVIVANTALSNLTTTSINQTLIPNADSTFDLGTAAHRWNNLFLDQIRNGANQVILSIGADTALESPAGNVVLNPTASGKSILVQADGGVEISNSVALFYSGFKVSPSIATTTIYTLPLTDGTNGQTLTTNGSKVLNWTSPTTGANQFLSNLLSPTAINQDLIFNTGAPASLLTQNSAVGSTQSLSLASGNATVSGNSGDIDIITGSSAAGLTGNINIQTSSSSVNEDSGSFLASTGATTGTGDSGLISLTTGQSADVPSGTATFATGGTTGAGSSGAVTINTGSASGTGGTGAVNITSGATADANSGGVNINTGAVTAGGGSGAISAITGSGPSTGNALLGSGDTNASGSNSGLAQISTGAATGAGQSGTLTLITGATVDGNSGDITLIPSPTSGTGTRGNIQFQDGSEGTPGYVWTSVDTVGSGHWELTSSSGANTFLSNLTSPTAVNQTLLPASSGTFDLGSAAAFWNHSYIEQALDSSNNTSVDFINRILDDTAGDTSVDWNGRLLLDAPGQNSLDWENRLLLSSSGATMVDWSTAGIINASTNKITNVVNPTNPQDAATKAYVDSAVIAGSTNNKELFTLSGTNITNQFIDLAHVAKNNSIDFLVQGEGTQIEGVSFDYSVNYTGGAGGNTRITFLNGLATGGGSALIAGDVVVAKYQY